MTRTIEVRGYPLAYALIDVKDLEVIDREWTARMAAPAACRNAVFRSYIGSARATRPESRSWAGALVVAARFAPGRLIEFEGAEGRLEVPYPPNYFEGEISAEEVRTAIARDLGLRIERAGLLPLKTLAAWSGLGRYGRNNIVYVEGMGTSLVLSAYWAERPAAPIPPPPGPAFLDRCASCDACRRSCPTGAIPSALGCIDAGRCLPLYNEIEGEFPSWLDPRSHNALIGCVRCQLACPENRPFAEGFARVGPFGPRQLELLLAGEAREESDALISELSSRSDPESIAADRPVMARNLRAFVEAARARGASGSAG